MSGLRRGVVLRDEGSRLVVDLGGEEVPCVARKSLRHKAGGKKAVAVGDRVAVEPSGDAWAIVEVEERTSAISRRDPSHPRREQVLVANVDSVLVVASAREPDFVPGLIDRFLVAAERRELRAGLLVNKIDLDPDRAYAEAAALYRDLGYPVLEASAATGAGLDAVRDFLAGHVTTLLGHSGVGKSSLANALDPSLRLRTAEVRSSGLGAHTTTTVSLLRLPWGGYLVDTPGIREFGLWDLEPRELTHFFRGVAAHAAGCRFNDCLHEEEPGCAVKRAVKEGALALVRYEAYRRILESLRDETPPPY